VCKEAWSLLSKVGALAALAARKARKFLAGVTRKGGEAIQWIRHPVGLMLRKARKGVLKAVAHLAGRTIEVKEELYQLRLSEAEEALRAQMRRRERLERELRKCEASLDTHSQKKRKNEEALEALWGGGGAAVVARTEGGAPEAAAGAEEEVIPQPVVVLYSQAAPTEVIGALSVIRAYYSACRAPRTGSSDSDDA